MEFAMCTGLLCKGPDVMKELVLKFQNLIEKGVLEGEGAVAFRTETAAYISKTRTKGNPMTIEDFITLEDDFKEDLQELPKEYFLYLAIFDAFPRANIIIRTETESVLTASIVNRTIRPLLDDMASVMGPSLRSVNEGLWNNPQKIVRATTALKGRNGLLIQNNGLICIGASFTEIERIALMIEKGCFASIGASFLGGGYPIGFLRSWILHKSYQLRLYKQNRQLQE